MIENHNRRQIMLSNPLSKARAEKRGRALTSSATWIIILLAFAIIGFVTFKGLGIFIVDGGSVVQFFTQTIWNPAQLNELGQPLIGALPLIFGSFAVTLLAAIISAPFAIGTAIFMTQISPNIGRKVMQPIIELLVGIPSVVYGFIGLSTVVPFLRTYFPGSGFGIAAGTVVLSIMILPTIMSLAVNALETVPKEVKEASLALGCTRWQTTYQIVLKASLPGLLTAIIFGMARAFGEALAVQMVIGNSTVIPDSLLEPAATLTSILTMGMGYTVMGSMQNNALWSLALVLLLMSLFFIIIVRILGARRVYK